MKFTITVDVEDDFEKDAILNAVQNKLKLDQLYDEVFRPIIKYGQDEAQIEAYEMVWEKLTSYLNDD